MRLLLFSDLRLDAPGPESAEERRTAFARICDLARDLQVDALCCAGDLFDQNHLAPDTHAVLSGGFASIRHIPVFLTPGRSDWLSPGSLYRQAWSTNVTVFTDPHLTTRQLAPTVYLHGAAHVSQVHQLGFLGDFEVRTPGLNLALFYGCERTAAVEQGGVALTAPFNAHQIGDAGLDHAMVGGLPGAKGTPDYTYSGAGRAVLLTVHSDESVDQEWLTLAGSSGSSPFVKVPERAAPGRHGADEVVAPGGWLAQTGPAAGTTGTAAALADPFGKPGATASLPVPVEEPDPYDDPEYPESTVRGQFVRSIRRGELSPADQSRVLRIGLAAIDGQTDFGDL